MTFKQKVTEGQIVELNGKDYRATADGFEPVVSKGPLGGELKMLADCIPGEVVYMQMAVETFDRRHVMCRSLTEKGAPHPIFQTNRLVETNIPPRPTFTPMTAGEAAKLPDIVGRWVAVRVCKKSSDELVLGDEIYERWFDRDDQILLIEGVDL